MRDWTWRDLDPREIDFRDIDPRDRGWRDYRPRDFAPNRDQLPIIAAGLGVGILLAGLFYYRKGIAAQTRGIAEQTRHYLGYDGDASDVSEADGLENDGVFADLDPEVDDLDPLRWENRAVLIFAPMRAHPEYQRQRKMLQEVRDGLADRDVVVLSDTDATEHGALRAGYGVHEFEVLVFGKDGGLKLRQSEPLKADELFELIDGMPMRQREMGEV